jgi:hypothetical protein
MRWWLPRLTKAPPLPRLDLEFHKIVALNETQVVKTYFEQDDQYDSELEAYSRLCPHPYIAHFFGHTDDGIVLERGTCPRKILQETKGRDVPLATILR